jgi:hypothetical protein
MKIDLTRGRLPGSVVLRSVPFPPYAGSKRSDLFGTVAVALSSVVPSAPANAPWKNAYKPVAVAIRVLPAAPHSAAVRDGSAAVTVALRSAPSGYAPHRWAAAN